MPLTGIPKSSSTTTGGGTSAPPVVVQSQAWQRLSYSTGVFGASGASILPPVPRAGLALQEILALREIDFGEVWDPNSNADCAATLQAFLIEAHLLARAIHVDTGVQDDVSMRSFVTVRLPRGTYYLSASIIVPEHVALLCDGILIRGTGGSTSLSGLLQLPALIVVPGAHVLRATVNCSPDGVNQLGSGVVVGKNWQIASVSVASAGSGYSQGDVLTLGNPSRAPYVSATVSPSALSGTGAITGARLVTSGAYGLPPALQGTTWTNGNGFSVLDASGNFRATGGTGSGATFTVTWAPDWALSNPVYQIGTLLSAATRIDALRIINAGRITNTTNGECYGVLLASGNVEIGNLEVLGGQVGVWMQNASAVRVGAIKTSQAATGLRITGASQITLPNVVLGTSTYLPLEIDSGADSVSLTGQIVWNDGFDATLGAPHTSGFAVKIGTTTQVNNIVLDLLLKNAGAVTPQPAVFLAHASGTRLDLVAGNANGSVSVAKKISALVSFGASVDPNCLIRGQVGGIAANIFAGNIPPCGIDVWDSTAQGRCKPGGLYDLIGSGNPSAANGASKAATGSFYTNTAAGSVFVNQGSAAVPNWILVAAATSALPPSTTESANGTTLTGTTGSITDSAGVVWTLVQSQSSGLQVAANGTVDATTANVVKLEYANKQIWQLNTVGEWYYKAFLADTWHDNGTTAPTISSGTSGGAPVITATPGTPQLLSPGFHSTNGPLIVDSRGVPQRWCFAGWAGMDAEGPPFGVGNTSYTTILDSLKAGGFNGIGLTYDDFFQTANNSTFLSWCDQIITYCGTIGMKVQLRRMGGRYQANPPHGIAKQVPYDNTTVDNNGITYTNTLVQNNLVALARKYAGNSTVVGMEIWNELVTGGVSGPTNAQTYSPAWGDTTVGPVDCRALAQTWGNAIQAVNPDIIVVVQGIQTYGVYGNAGLQGTNFTDLSFVHGAPVSLNIPKKVVYSFHGYPEYTPGINRTDWNRLVGVTRNAGYPVLNTETGNPIVATSGNYATWQPVYQDFLAWLDCTSNGNGAAPTPATPIEPGIGFHTWTVATPAEVGPSDEMALFNSWGGSLNATEMQDVKNHFYFYKS